MGTGVSVYNDGTGGLNTVIDRKSSTIEPNDRNMNYHRQQTTHVTTANVKHGIDCGTNSTANSTMINLVGNPKERGEFDNVVNMESGMKYALPGNGTTKDTKKLQQPTTPRKPTGPRFNRLLEDIKRHQGISLEEKKMVFKFIEDKENLLASTDSDFSQHTRCSEIVEDETEGSRGDWKTCLDDIEKCMKEKQDLLNTISEITCARLKNNNPAIVDLSDGNRPSKLAERFSELYDNEWTDVVEVLEVEDDRGRKGKEGANEELDEEYIIFMVKFVEVAYDICKHRADKYLSTLTTAIVGSDQVTPDVSRRCKEFLKLQMSSGSQSLPSVVKIVCKEAEQRLIEEQDPKGTRWKQLLAILNTNDTRKCFSTYCDICVELCLYMCLQDPPVSMMATITSETTTDHFRAFTRSGKRPEYVVWPALFLYQRGPLLYKGVAQYAMEE